MLQRVRNRERTLEAIDAVLRDTGDGLPPVPIERPSTAATSADRILPGRAQSGLEDVLWLLLHLRAGQLRDTLERAAELQRADGLTAWEQLVLREVRRRAILDWNAVVAVSLDATERAFARVLNDYRMALGLAPFELEERLNAAARKHSQEMVDLGYFGHISPVARNRGPTDRVRLEGYAGGVGENCLAGHADARGAFAAWYHSPGHHRGMVARSPHLGVGAVADHSMWTMVMGGTDDSWRALHRDLPPARRADCRRAASELARALDAPQPRGKRQQERIARARAAVADLGPDVLPAIAGLAFPSARDPRAPHHTAAPELLTLVAHADVPRTWRPLQVAAVAAAIDLLRLGRSSALRARALRLVAPLLGGQTGGYAADAPAGARHEAVLEMRAHWEDHAQWNFRRDAPPPEGPVVPGRRAVADTARGDGPSERAKLRALSARERMQQARQHGGGGDTERAVERGLDFLARVQNEDGGWRARAFTLQLDGVEPRAAGPGNAEWDIASSGLALLAIVSAGHTTEQGDHQDCVRRGVRWLAARVEDYGRFETTSSHYMYGHAMATQALCEVYAYTADPYVGTVAQLALDYLAFAQHAGGGWRYNARQAGDASVTGWVVMALNSGFKAGLDVVGFRDALRFIDAVTMPGYYQVGYTGRPGLGGENLRRTSIGMVSRLFLGESPQAPEIALPAWRLVEQPPQRRAVDFYYWYYATLALFQVGGQHWQEWNDALKPLLLRLQVDDRGSPLHGSWSPDGAYGRQGGRIYQTALGVLMLTTYYRYDRSPKVKLHPFTGNLREVAAPYLDALRAETDAHRRAVVLRKLVDELGPSLVPVLCDAAVDETLPEDVRQQLASALPSVALPRHETMLLDLLGAGDADVAVQAARAVAEVATARSAPGLIGALDHGNAAVRTWAARALGRLGVHDAVAALQRRAERETHGGAKNAMQRALRRLAHRDELAQLIDAALPPGTAGRVAAFDAFALLDRGGMAKLLLQRREAEPKLWRKLVDVVHEFGGGGLVPALIVALESAELAIRKEAIRLLIAITGHRHGFHAEAPPRERRRALHTWQQWWDEAGAGFATGDGR